MDKQEEVKTYNTNRILIEEGWYSIQDLEQLLKAAKEQKRQTDTLLRKYMEKTK